MRGASLFVVFVLARVLTLPGHPLPLSVLSPLAYVWQDALVALAFHVVFERWTRRQWPARVAYGALVLLAAVNVPVIAALSSPVTAPMLRATRGPLADSFRYYATPVNVSMVLAVLVAGTLLPGALRRLACWTTVRFPEAPASLGSNAMAAMVAFVLVGGSLARTHVDTRGLERNGFLALARSVVPRVGPQRAITDFRASLGSPIETADLSALRGTASGRDVVLVVLESTAAQYLAPYGAADDPMPNLTALATRALVVENAYAVYPESIKGLVSIFASRYPAFDVAAEEHAPLMSSSLSWALRGAGYETGLFHSGRFMYLGMEEVLGAAGFDRLEDAGDIGGEHESSFGIDEESTVDRLLHWVDSLPTGRRFLAAYLPIAGHHPYGNSGAGPYSAEREIDRYRNALFDADRALGRLIAGLRARGREDSTLLVVIGDHGEAFGQHAGNFAHTLALFEENVRVPFVIGGAGLSGQRRVTGVASLVDVAPTMLDLLGIRVPLSFHGTSILDGTPRAALFFTDYSLGLLGVRDGCRKFIYELESRRGRLFDVCRDPAEQVDLASARPVWVAAYRQRLESWAAAQVAEVRDASRRTVVRTAITRTPQPE